MSIIRIVVLLSLFFLMASCAKIGSKNWCEEMKQKSRGDWTFNEAKTYASKCAFRKSDNKNDQKKD